MTSSASYSKSLSLIGTTHPTQERILASSERLLQHVVARQPVENHRWSISELEQKDYCETVERRADRKAGQMSTSLLGVEATVALFSAGNNFNSLSVFCNLTAILANWWHSRRLNFVIELRCLRNGRLLLDTPHQTTQCIYDTFTLAQPMNRE